MKVDFTWLHNAFLLYTSMMILFYFLQLHAFPMALQIATPVVVGWAVILGIVTVILTAMSTATAVLMWLT